MNAIILSILFLSPPSLNNAVELSRNGDYIGSLQVMSKFRPTEQENGTYHYYKMLNHFFLNQKSLTLKEAEYLEGFNIELPEGFKVVTHLVKEEASLWKQDFTDLDDISRDMLKVKDKLLNGYAGKATQKEQDLIVKRLNKLIEEAEKKKKGKGDGEDGKDDSNPGGVAGRPAEQSQILEDSGKGDVNNKAVRKLSEKWGSMPPRERQQALQELTQGMSARHREAIENYFRNLSFKKR